MPPAVANEPSNGRLSDRVSTSTVGLLMSEDRKVLMDCIVTNISSTGARLMVSSPAEMPEDVVIFFADSGIRWPCRVVRRSGMEIGVRFK